MPNFWDCNPYIVEMRGHFSYSIKKITPGAHWIGITTIASQKENLDLTQTSAAYVLVSVTLADAFISNWDEKYRSNLVRPETLINTYIDEKWSPLLQTPPFPEYTSGHSVISTAAATVLTSFFDAAFEFEDTSEVKYGIESRHFNSFFHASQEAAISRLYGGIHYRQAIEEGVNQGKKVGNFVLNNLFLTQNKLITLK